jgi:hypothetical protein
MPFPTPLTPAQVGGAEKNTMTDCHFVNGVYRGKTLVVALSDANLATGISAGDVIVPKGTVPT